MKHVPIATFKDKVSQYVAEVEAGDEIMITRHGRPAARLSAAPTCDAERRRRVDEALAGLAQLRSEMRAAGMRVSMDEIIAWKNEGRR